MDKSILYKFHEAPFTYTVLVIVFTCCIVVIAKYTKSPIETLLNTIVKLCEIALKEISFRAGITGVIDLVGTVILFISALAIYFKSFIASLISGGDNNSHAFVMFLLTLGWLLISLYWTREQERHISIKKIKPDDL